MSHHPTTRTTSTTATDLLLYILAIFIPPFPVFIKTGCSGNFIINLLLTFIAWFPGIIHAWWVIYRRPDSKYPITGQDYGSGKGYDGRYARNAAQSQMYNAPYGQQGNMDGYYGPPPAQQQVNGGMVRVPVQGESPVVQQAYPVQEQGYGATPTPAYNDKKEAERVPAWSEKQ